ncbi:hypothetical protein GQR58_014198 [Nymphon striatum]|nr:hypothetical protein GQR58_014198 [Nymphon striatum]
MERPHLMDGVHGYYLPYHAGEEHIGEVGLYPAFRFKQRGFFPYCVGHSPIFSTRQDTFVVYLPLQAERFLSILCWAFANFFNRVSVIAQVSEPYVSTARTHLSYTFRFKQRESGNLDSNIGTRIAGYVFPLMSRASNLRTLISNESKSFLKKHEFSEGTG